MFHRLFATTISDLISMRESTTFLCFFFFNDTATTEIYTLSLHDALPIATGWPPIDWMKSFCEPPGVRTRSEEHTSELQSRGHLVCRLLLEKKKTNLKERRGENKNIHYIVKYGECVYV